MRILFLANEPVFYRPPHKLDHGVVPLLHEFSQVGDGRSIVIVESRHAKHQLVLLGRHAMASSRAFAEPQKFTQAIAKTRKILHQEKRAAVSPF